MYQIRLKHKGENFYSILYQFTHPPKWLRKIKECEKKYTFVYTWGNIAHFKEE